MSLRKRLHYAWHVFWTEPRLLEYSFERMDELTRPVEQRDLDHITIKKRERGGLLKVRRHVRQMARDMGMNVGDDDD